MITKVVSIYPDIAAQINAVKLYPHPFALTGLLPFQRPPVPTDTCGQISAIPSGRALFIECTFDAPVVGYIQHAPFVVAVLDGLSAGYITEVKTPIEIKRCT